MNDDDVTAIKAMFKRRDADRFELIKKYRAEGNQAALDELLQYVDCANEVNDYEMGCDWTSLWYSGPFGWRQRAWLRDTAGRWCLYYGRSGDPDCELRFEKAEDAFAFKMRWA
ncbi:MAG: hypothetical protein EOP83_14775 [Verrucomicrobiaceae bacterium]|nr:MAG: hypothetical protein EOP83_14775 [Verrucomicrobiaceae bacterium]